MAKAYRHAENSARKFGGRAEDYLEIHTEMDGAKSAHATVKHRVLYHHAYGIFVIEKIFGATLVNSDGNTVCVRDVAEQHVIEDLGYIPSLDEYLEEMQEQPWMAGAARAKRLSSFQLLD